MQDKQEFTRIEKYNLADFVLAIEAAVKQGFELNVDHNDHYPMNYGGFYRCTMFKPTKDTKRQPEDMSKYTDINSLVKPATTEAELEQRAEQPAPEQPVEKQRKTRLK